MDKKVLIYTDGACRGNPGPGGWAALLIYGTEEKELWGGEANTTNNRMELTAPLEALKALKRPLDVSIYTDSQYVQKGMTQWIHTWKANHWKTAQKLLETLLYGSQDRSTQNSDKDSDQGSEKTSELPPEQNPAQDKAKNSKQDSQKDPQKTPERPKTSEKFSSPEQKQGHKAAPDPVLVLNCAIASFFNEDESALNRLRDTFRGVMNQTPQGKAFDLLTRQEEAFYPSKVALASKLSDLKTFEDFLKDIQKDSL